MSEELVGNLNIISIRICLKTYQMVRTYIDITWMLVVLNGNTVPLFMFSVINK